MKGIKKQLLSFFMTLCLLMAFLPATAFAAEGDVAQIGDKTYATLDAAVEAAEEGATITLLADATTNGLNLSKDLTIEAANGLDKKPTITFTQYGIALWGKALTFKNCNVVMNGIGSTPYTGEWNWMSICANSDASLTLDNVNMTMDATGTTNSPHAIYFCNNNVLNVNNSVLTIKNYANDALEWDGGNGGYNVNITDSTFISDHNRSGFTGTFYATITNSDVDVINSTGNGSNGSHFIIKDSDVNFSDNGSHGLSAGELSIENSKVTTNNNKGMGITVNNGLTIFNHSNVEVSGNAANSSYGYAAVRLYNNFDFTVDSTSKLRIIDNNNTGLYVRQGSLNVEDGAVLRITGNDVTHYALGGYGGGIYIGYGNNYDPTVTLPADAKIYNNHALTGGDDIYVSQGVNGPSLTFGKVGSKWRLDGDPDCEDKIDGWYDDSEGTRWEAHGETPEANHVEEFTEFNGETGLATITGLTALKAAHGIPKEKISLPGLDKSIVLTNGKEVDQDDVAAGDTVNFKLASNVPENLKDYITYTSKEPEVDANALGNAGEYILTFHDQMDDAFVDPENFEVKIGDTPLKADQYTLTQTGLNDGCDFEISLDLAALYNADVITEDDLGVTPITVTYTATLKKETTAGTYKNTAWVSYPDDESKKDTVTVDTYQIKIFKYDQADNAGLEGAKFDFYQKDTEDNIIEDSVIKLTSGEDGYIVVDGLDAGTYYLKETEAPDGYVCSDTELTVTIPNDAGEDNIANVKFANSEIPNTGGNGTRMYMIIGGVIVIAAGLLLVVSRKSRKNQAS